MAPMPINPAHVPKEEAKFPVLPDDVYSVEIEDIELDVKPDKFAKPDENGVIPDREQYCVKFKVLEPAEHKDRQIRSWLNTTLRVSTKSKRPGLAQFLKAVTGKEFGVDDREKLTGDFMNSLIGSKLRVSVILEVNKSGNEFSAVTSYLKASK